MNAGGRTEIPDGRVAVAMSGGVDSSVAAALLVEQGYDVVGVHMKLADVPDDMRHGKSCCSLDDSLDARQVCAELGIPYYVFDFREEFRREVVDYFIAGYRAGLTPNPCAMCNLRIKNSALLDRIREIGCDYLATGHYARIRENPVTGSHEMVRPRDLRKDQTYFLFGTPREELPALLFPLAEFVKDEARALAAKLGFVTWDKPDSQEICFVPSDYRDFLRPHLGDMPEGDFVDRAGNVLGRHRGVALYTVGQRRGLGIGGARPYYVVAIDREANRVLLGEESDLYSSRVKVGSVNWVSRPPPERPLDAVVKIRYADAGTPARVSTSGGTTAEVIFSRPVKAVTPGQAAVFYDGDVLLGGGWIEAGEP